LPVMDRSHAAQASCERRQSRARRVEER
jgi:hypothetical protein